jgi:hypothetical protein
MDLDLVSLVGGYGGTRQEVGDSNSIQQMNSDFRLSL